MTINRKTAQLLERVAAVFRVKEGDSFRVKAYNNAATAIENLTEPIDLLWQQGKLDMVPGLGEGLTAHLNEYFKKGSVRHWDAQFKKVPAGMFALMDIRGIGPMTAYKIAKKFQLNNEKTAIKELRQLIREGKLAKIESFKEKSVERLKKSLKIKSVGKGRILLADALSIAEDFIAYLKQSPGTITAEPLGSLRRRLPTVGDIDLAVNTKDPEKTMRHALDYPKIISIITKGDKVSHVKLNSGFEVDIKLSEPGSWGSLLQHYTGSKMHNIKLRTLALKKGYSLSEYGIKVRKKLNRFKTEAEFYRFLGLPLIPPEIREDEGEIELALKGNVPKLVEEGDIKGDLHIHSGFDFPSSHDLGASSLQDLLKKAARLGYEYIGLADHNPKYIDLTEKEKEKILSDRKKYLEKEYRAYEKTVKKRSINLLIGMEVDIRPSGDLALSDNLLNTLDYVIASIHSGFELTKEINTKRIIRGLSHPKVKILGHPSGRKLDGREGMSIDWEQIFDFCLKNKKIIEINAYPDRLDPPDEIIRQGIAKGVKFTIDTDSHAAPQMECMKYGVWLARKGYAGKSSLINTLSWKNLQTMLQ